MRFSYGWLGRSVARYSKQLMLALGLLALPITIRLDKANAAKPAPPPITPPQPISPPPVSADPRAVRLKKFFSKLHCPVTYLAEDFVQTADQNSLDWRLLPSISVVESGGGKAYRNNNIFGWNNGQTLFPTIRAGLHEVAYKLGKSPLYRNRDVMGKLHLYNPDETYATSVVKLMNRISPVVNLNQAQIRMHRQSQMAYASD